MTKGVLRVWNKEPRAEVGPYSFGPDIHGDMAMWMRKGEQLIPLPLNLPDLPARLRADGWVEAPAPVLHAEVVAELERERTPAPDQRHQKGRR